MRFAREWKVRVGPDTIAKSPWNLGKAVCASQGLIEACWRGTETTSRAAIGHRALRKTVGGMGVVKVILLSCLTVCTNSPYCLRTRAQSARRAEGVECLCSVNESRRFGNPSMHLATVLVLSLLSKSTPTGDSVHARTSTHARARGFARSSGT
jgi:hypothetical protein